ncbi:hypothetical protein B0T10DRAFT_539774 [Thelonectria olida]|uniref:Uncharacterized protein n=1 Tax=Thelonectria olida TaxID=1576542 RepID=A0A9P8VZG1_9HYPO|nr:hypothetical protein B0T10DRAFT_539774 [Thelonectria olida]
MVSISTVKAANAQLPTILPNNLVAVFIGATSGIGLSALQQFVIATDSKQPRVYIVGRSASAAAPVIADLRQSNSSAEISFIEQDISLVGNVDKVVDEVKRHEEKLDFLFVSPGFIPFDGRRETSEGLEPSMTTRYYSRARAVQLLIPLLNQSANPHVTTILAGGQEAPLLEDDLDLAKPGNFSIVRSSVHSATMLTLFLERLASENPKISFVHAFPGLTSTPLLTRGSSGIVSVLLRWIFVPIVTSLFAYPVKDVGAKTLFYATNARFSVAETAALNTPLPEGLPKADQTAGGIFLVGEKGDPVDNEKVLVGLRKQLAEKVWVHTTQIFDKVTK